MAVKIIKTVHDMHRAADHIRQAGLRIGLVPTMGYLHEGHLSLVRQALKVTDRVVVSIFVNPLQFGPTEDLAAYPKDIDRDLKLLDRHGVHLAYLPQKKEIYPRDFATSVSVAKLTERLCGASRPGHFEGVTTIVTKLFAAVKPHVAVFGQKDAQQTIVIQRLVRDLNLDVEIQMAPTVREADGLAMSSRNAYLNAEERREAPALYRALMVGTKMIARGERRTQTVIEAMRDVIAPQRCAEIDYIEAVDAKDLTPVAELKDSILLAVAVRFGNARLIDNALVRIK
ncbi:MAG: pantoate--beta-alanine ligase [Candidatus Latescibacteria bacterium]|nr:pantoate--beta-alanine ligase [Candidatus Latescibacterota bacterium]